MLKQRSFWGWFFLTILTCGIYGLYWVYITTKSVNQLAQGDNRDFSPVLAVVLYIVTCGIYPIIWYYTQGERLKDTGTRMGVQVQDSGVTYLLWILVGSLLCGLGPLIATAKFLKNYNNLVIAYNARVANGGQVQG